MARSRVLIVGGTGYIGRRFVKTSLALGHPTFVLCRPEVGFDIEKVHMLLSFKQNGAKLLEGSFADPQSLVAALKQVDVVISAIAGNHFNQQILQQLKLVEAIKEAGNIKRFLPSEFGMDPDRMENALEPGGLAQLGRLMPPHDSAVMYGDGNVKAVWVEEDDTGIYTLKMVDDPRTLNKTVYIRPPQNILSQKELVEKWEQLSGNTLKKTYISAEDFLAGMEDKPYEHQIGISHFYHMFYRGDLYNFEIGADAREATQLYPEVKYTTMDSYLKRYL